MESTYTINGKQFELQHHGVKGMKWGVRRYQNKDGSLTSAGIRKRFEDERKESIRDYNRKVASAKNTYKSAKKSAREELKARHKVNYEKAELDKKEHDARQGKVKKGAKAVAGTLAKLGSAYVVDQTVFGGMGTTACKEAIRVIGMSTITAAKMAGGAYDIKWYDKSGNRIG